MSKDSKKLKKFEGLVLERFLQNKLPTFGAKSTKSLFKVVRYDGVFQDADGNIVIVEVAFGGGDKKLKPGPQRKMLADALKLVSANTFLRNQNHVIARRILIVRSEGVGRNIGCGWKGTVLKSHNVEVIPADISTAEEAEIKAILKICTEEQVHEKQGS